MLGLFKNAGALLLGAAEIGLAAGVVRSAYKFATRPAQKQSADAQYNNG